MTKSKVFGEKETLHEIFEDVFWRSGATYIRQSVKKKVLIR